MNHQLKTCLMILALCLALIPMPTEAAVDFTFLFDNTAPTVVIVKTGRSLGSGFVISSDGYILTNKHVVGDVQVGINVGFKNGKEFTGKLFYQDQKIDFAILKVDVTNLPVARLGNPDQLKSGEEVYAIGAPFGLEYTLNRGIISSINRDVEGSKYIQSDVLLNEGNSGGPLFNLKGEVVGINTMILKNAQGISFSIPINDVFPVLKERKIAVNTSMENAQLLFYQPPVLEKPILKDQPPILSWLLIGVAGMILGGIILILFQVSRNRIIFKKGRSAADQAENDFEIELK
jgi:S1-C subfamily serine protease